MKSTASSTSPSPAPRRSLWPAAIITYFAIFITGLVAFGIWAARQNVDLVRKDYYAEEILFQNQLDSVSRTRPFLSEVAVDYSLARQTIQVRLPSAHVKQALTGRVKFYRPSDARLDRELPLQPDVSGAQQFDARALLPGLWKVRLLWNSGGENFYFDQSVVIGG